MTLMLAAIDEGLDTAIFGVTDFPRLRRALGLPDDLHFVAVVTMGHPADAQADKPSGGASVFTQRRKPRSEVVRWERW
jgi:nitroreductase